MVRGSHCHLPADTQEGGAHEVKAHKEHREVTQPGKQRPFSHDGTNGQRDTGVDRK